MNNFSEDIEKLRKILKCMQHRELSEFLAGARSRLSISSTFGSKWFSNLSTFEIYVPIDRLAALQNISTEQKKQLLKCIQVLYPVQDNSPEVTEFEIFPDVEKMSDVDLVDPVKLRTINYDHIQDQIRKCREKIDKDDLDGAVTNARTLLESTCLFILEEAKVSFEHQGKLQQLYKETCKTLKMDSALYTEENLKKIITGAVSIVDGIAGLRNSYSDAHGIAPKERLRLSKRHVVLVTNLAKTISEFLYSSWDENRSR